MADIKQLTDREHCRQRVGMYLGGIAEEGETNPESLRTAIREAVDNSKDELISGYGNTIWIFTEDTKKNPLSTDKFEGKSVKSFKEWIRYTVADNASGIPIKPSKNIQGQTITMMELALSNFRAGSKFSKDVAIIGLNGIGISACVFTSAEFSCYTHLSCHDLNNTTDHVKDLMKEAKVTKTNAKNFYYKITWNIGLKVSDEIVSFKDDDILNKYWGKSKELPSTVSTFIPDPTIHGTTVAEIPKDFAYLGYINKDFNFYINNEKVNSDIGFKYSDTVKINLENPPEECKNPWIQFSYSIEIADKLDEEIERYSVNTLDCKTGKHKDIWRMCYTEAFCTYFDDHEIEKYAMDGVNVLVILQCPEPSFNSQTKEKCTSIEGWGNKIELYEPLVKSILKIIKKNEDVFRQNYNRIHELFLAKQNLGKLKELKKILGDMTKENRSMSRYMPKKLLDCPCKDRSRAEVFWCEGDSASGAFVKARAGYDNIAIMPLRGKILNTVNMDINKAMENDEIKDITYICGGVDDVHVDPSKLYFGQFNIASDSDSDGLHIAVLLLGHLLKNHSFLFGTPEKDYEDSRVFRIEGALYSFGKIDGTDENKYFYAGEENIMNEWKKNHTYKTFKRFKGLGEISKKEMQDMYLNPKTRRTIKIKPQDVSYCLNLVDPDNKEARQDLMIERGVFTRDTLDLSKQIAALRSC